LPGAFDFWFLSPFFPFLFVPSKLERSPLANDGHLQRDDFARRFVSQKVCNLLSVPPLALYWGFAFCLFLRLMGRPPPLPLLRLYPFLFFASPSLFHCPSFSPGFTPPLYVMSPFLRHSSNHHFANLVSFPGKFLPFSFCFPYSPGFLVNGWTFKIFCFLFFAIVFSGHFFLVFLGDPHLFCTQSLGLSDLPSLRQCSWAVRLVLLLFTGSFLFPFPTTPCAFFGTSVVLSSECFYFFVSVDGSFTSPLPGLFS